MLVARLKNRVRGRDKYFSLFIHLNLCIGYICMYVYIYIYITKLAYSDHSQSQVWKSAEGLSAHWRFEGSSQMLGAQRSVPCKSVKILCWKAGDNEAFMVRQTLELLQMNRKKPSFFYSLYATVVTTFLTRVGFSHLQVCWINLV